MIIGENMIKYDNLLIIICAFCIVIEIFACVVKLPNIIIYLVPVVLFIVGIVMIIGIIKQGNKKAVKNKKKK